MNLESFLQSRVPLATPYQRIDPSKSDTTRHGDDSSLSSSEEERPALVASKSNVNANVYNLPSQGMMGTGVCLLQDLIKHGIELECISGGARQVLQSLMTYNWIRFLPGDGPTSRTFSSPGLLPHFLATIKKVKETTEISNIDNSSNKISKNKMVEDAKQSSKGTKSLFDSILRLFPDDDTEVSTSTIIKTSLTAMRVADMPPTMNSKEVVLAALHFLSTNYLHDTTTPHDDTTSLFFPTVPLLQAVPNNNDKEEILEKIRYKRNSNAYPWSIRKVNCLEKAFFASTVQHPTRLRSCPRLTIAETNAVNKELNIMLTGSTITPSSLSGVTKGKRSSNDMDETKGEGIKRNKKNEELN